MSDVVALPWNDPVRFEYGPILGEGTCAVIHLVRDAVGRLFAAKVLRPEARMSPVELQVLTACAARGARNIVRLHRTTHNGRVLILEYCDGGTVANSITRPTTIDSRVALHIARDVTRALMDLHALGCIHRDVKPSNMLLLRRHGRLTAVLADFSEALCATRKLESQLYGTPEYAAPELLWQCPCGCTQYEYTQAVDVWALGITLFELLFRCRPFDEGLDLPHLPQRVAAVRSWLQASYSSVLLWLEQRRYEAAAQEDFAFAASCDAIRDCLTWCHHERPTAATVYEILGAATRGTRVPRRRSREA
jgi:serine/threonine protein kinase